MLWYQERSSLSVAHFIGGTEARTRTTRWAWASTHILRVPVLGPEGLCRDPGTYLWAGKEESSTWDQHCSEGGIRALC